MRHSSDCVEPVNTTARVTVDVWDSDGNEILETLIFDVEVSGYPEGDTKDLEIGKVVCVECGYSADTRRRPGQSEGTTLVNQFHAMQANKGDRFDEERDEIAGQLKEAIHDAAYEATGATNPFSRNFEGY